MAKPKITAQQRNQQHSDAVAQELIQRLKNGTAPWQKPWQPGETGQAPFNPTTGNPYKGGNAVWLEMQQPDSDPRWMTYRQAEAEGWQVRKGEKGTTIEHWRFTKEVDVTDENGRPVKDEEGKTLKQEERLEFPQVRHFAVFHASQIDGIPAWEPKKQDEKAELERHEEAERLLAESRANIRHKAGDKAFYSPAGDYIQLPEREQFDTADGYYATALHELGHWTGHESRLNRDLNHRFGSEGYAREELRAEISSMMVARELGVGHDPGQHAAYVGSWIKALEEDPREIFRAARDAEKIKDFVLQPEKQRELADQERRRLTAIEKSSEEKPRSSEKPQSHEHSDRIYFNVSFKERKAAKEVGAKWDREQKSWYADNPDAVAALSSHFERRDPEPQERKRVDVEPKAVTAEGEREDQRKKGERNAWSLEKKDDEKQKSREAVSIECG